MARALIKKAAGLKAPDLGSLKGSDPRKLRFGGVALETNDGFSEIDR